MTQGLLANSFTGVAFKRLSAVEADINRSHQHEFNGVTNPSRVLESKDYSNEIKRPVELRSARRLGLAHRHRPGVRPEKAAEV